MALDAKACPTIRGITGARLDMARRVNTTASGRQPPLAIGNFPKHGFQRLLCGAEIEGLNFRSVPIRAGGETRERPFRRVTAIRVNLLPQWQQ